jgi:NTE family protein
MEQSQGLEPQRSAEHLREDAVAAEHARHGRAPVLAPRRSGAPRVVLVLGGGGMRGMAHIGVLKGLATLGIHVDAIVGTSIGSLVGAMAAGGLTLQQIEQRIEGLRKEDYFRLNVVKFLLKGTRAPSMYRGDTFRARLTEILPEVGFADLALPFYCNAVRLETGGSVFWGSPGMTQVSLIDAVYSSCALPGIFEPFHDGEFNYMDGGIVDPVPLRFARTLQPEVIIAVDLTVKATMKTPNYQNRAVSTLFRAFEIAEEVVAEQNLHMHVDYKVALVQPKVAHLSRFGFDDVPAVVELGYSETIRCLTAHAATRDLVRSDLPEGVACPVQPRDYVSVRLDRDLCIGCGLCEMVCETDAFWARGDKATVRKLSNYECTRDHACARNCPTGAIRLGNL